MKKTLLAIAFLMLLFTNYSFSSENKFPEMDFYKPDEAIGLLTEHLSKVEPDFIGFINLYNKAYIIDIVFLRKLLNEDNEELEALAFIDLIKNTSNNTHEEFTLFAKKEINRIAESLITDYVFDRQFVKYEQKQKLLWDFIQSYHPMLMNKIKTKMSLNEEDFYKEIMKIENPTQEDFSKILFQPLIGKTIKEFIEN